MKNEEQIRNKLKTIHKEAWTYQPSNEHAAMWLRRGWKDALRWVLGE